MKERVRDIRHKVKERVRDILLNVRHGLNQRRKR